MRAKEFINEDTDNLDSANQGSAPKGKIGKMHDHHDAALDGLTTIPDMPGMYYGMYRFGIHMAASPTNPPHEHGPTANHMVLAPYSKQEEEIINHTAKAMGMKTKKVTSSGSSEPTDTHTKSPVAAPKRNKYGV